MPLDTGVISDIGYKVFGASLRITWVSSDPTKPAQVYCNNLLQWHGRGQSASIPIPPSGSRVTIGTVDFGEEGTDFSSTLPPVPHSRARLSWQGGTFQGADIHGFRIFGETVAGGGFGGSPPLLADIEAYAEGLASDGYGMGGYGDGGYGSASASYSWESEPYRTGTWSFRITPYDSVGNEGTPATVSVALTSAPAEVPLYSDRERLHSTYSQPSKTISLSWQESDG